LAAAVRGKVKERVAALPRVPGLAVLLVGDDPASHLYVALKEKACEEAGIRFERHAYPADADEAALVAKIEELNARADVDGILVQLPLPSQDADRVAGAIAPAKDVDGFHPENVRACAEGRPCLAPPVHLGVMKLLDATGVNVRGMRAEFVGSALFAAPLVALLRERGVETTVVPPDRFACAAARVLAADIVIAAAGAPGIITGDCLKPGAIVIDVGTTKVNGKLLGDADRASVDPVAGWISPVPGGVGPLTVAYLLLNVLKAHTQTRMQKTAP